MANKFKSAAQKISVDQAVGTALAHDITEIRPGQFKGPSFKKGHVIEKDDIAHLKRLGKEHLFVLKIDPGEVHEDEAAMRLAEALAGPGVHFEGPPSEGKINLKATHRGLLKVHVPALTKLCLISEICCASLHNHSVVEKESTLAATRAIPLVMDERILIKALDIAAEAGGIFSVHAFSNPSTGIIITGNEVYHGLIEDKFAPILRKKLEAFDCPVLETVFAPDREEEIAKCIQDLRKKGAEMILVAGGMSVDPDDVSRMAISKAGVKDMVYGTSVLPGAMFLYGRLGEVPVLGLPACVLYYKATVFDLMLPRVLAGEAITREALARLAHGGLCRSCSSCHFPICPFGKGS